MTVIRKDIMSLTPTELHNLREAHKLIMARIDNRSFARIASIHGWLEEWCEHGPKPVPGSPGRQFHLFLPWHRAYCYTLEKNLQTVSRDSTIALPFWNYGSPRPELDQIPTAYSEQTVEGQPNPLHHFRKVIHGRDRRTGQVINLEQDTKRNPGTLASARSLSVIRQRLRRQGMDIPSLLSENSFLEFSEKLRFGWHNNIHLYVGGMGGDFSDQNVAAYDPIFWPHHVQIDRIWRMWQKDHGAENMPEYMKDVPLTPFGRLRVRDVLNASTLEYDYARAVGEA
jgi:tyrosinase